MWMNMAPFSSLPPLSFEEQYALISRRKKNLLKMRPEGPLDEAPFCEEAFGQLNAQLPVNRFQWGLLSCHQIELNVSF